MRDCLANVVQQGGTTRHALVGAELDRHDRGQMRALKRVPGMPVLVGSIFKSLPALANVGGIAAFFFIIYAIVGVELFKGVLH
jgi:hypothetical protein